MGFEELEDRLAASATTLDNAIDRYTAGDVQLGSAVGSRLLTTLAVGALVAGGAVVLPLLATRDQGTAPGSPRTPVASPRGVPTESTVLPASDSPRSGSGPTLPSSAGSEILFDTPAQSIRWSAIRPESSIADGTVQAIESGPDGFVAIGMGFRDVSAGQGRVWYSQDGARWVEPDRELFAPQTILGLAATSDAYYVYATPTARTETASATSAQLYRSHDGADWQQIGEQTAAPGQLMTAGDLLLRTGTGSGEMLTSTDGLTWVPATIATGEDSTATTGSFDGQVLEAAGTYFVRSLAADGESVWSSTDGLSWSPIGAQPSDPGRLVATDRSLLSVGTSDAAACYGALSSEAPANPDAAIADLWECDIDPTFQELRHGADHWALIDDHMDVATPVWPGVTAFAGQLVATITSADGTVSVWTSGDSRTWEPTGVVLEPTEGELRGTPAVHWVEAQTDAQIVIPISIGATTTLIVGTITSPSETVG